MNKDKKGDVVLLVTGDIREIDYVSKEKKEIEYGFNESINVGGNWGRNYVYEDEIIKVLKKVPIIKKIKELNNQLNKLYEELEKEELGETYE